MPSDEIDLKKRIGKLGMYLIEQAKERIKELNQQILFQKAEIKKKFRKEEIKKSKELRQEFIEEYDHQLNTTMSSTLLDSKEKLLDLKNKLIEDYKNELRGKIIQRINDGYSNYINYILDLMKNIEKQIEASHRSVIYFNSRDFSYFSDHLDKVKDTLGNNVELNESPKIDIGGFRLEQVEEGIIFNYTIENTISKHYKMIEKQISNQITDSEIKDLQSEFESFINQKKEKKEDILIKYDRI